MAFDKRYSSSYDADVEERSTLKPHIASAFDRYSRPVDTYLEEPRSSPKPRKFQKIAVASKKTSLDEYACHQDFTSQQHQPHEGEKYEHRDPPQHKRNRSVTFEDDPVANVNYIPVLEKKDVSIMFYSRKDFYRFRKASELARKRARLILQQRKEREWQQMNKEEFYKWQSNLHLNVFGW